MLTLVVKHTNQCVTASVLLLASLQPQVRTRVHTCGSSEASSRIIVTHSLDNGAPQSL